MWRVLLYSAGGKYLLVGFLGAILEYIGFLALIRFKYSILASNVISYHLALVVCYILHFFFTHRMVKKNGIINRFVRYLFLMYFQFFLGLIVLIYFIEYIEFEIEISKLMQIILVTPLSYLVQKTFIFNSRS